MFWKTRQIFLLSQQKFLTTQAYLKIRNSETYELAIPTLNQESIQIQVPKRGSLADLTKQLKEKMEISNIRYLCNQKIMMPESTLIDVLITRYFYVLSEEYNIFAVEG